MNNNLENRQIRIFISSTFLDMEEERKHLMEDIFPLLHDKAMQRDVSLTALDLRWGIPQKEVEKGRTIEICMNEIDNSRPFFIGLIGARYGWCPSINEYYNNDNLKERFPLLEGFFKERLSVTDMEMRYAVLNRDICDMDIDAFFFLKKTMPFKTGKEEYLKLEQLKKDIQEKKSLFPVYEYASVKEIGEHVLNEFENVLDRYFPVDDTNISSLQRERNRQKAYRNHLCRNYIGISAYIDKLDSFLNSRNKKIVLVGESGMGKSALLAKWLQEHDKDKFNNIIYHFVGNGESECNHLQIVSRIIDEIRDIYNIQIGENEERQESYMDADVRIERMFRRIPEDKHMVIVIDGLNQITDVQDSKLLRWLPEPPENVKYIFSTLENDKTYTALQQKDFDILRLKALELEQRKELIVRYLKSFCKELDSEEQIQTIASDPQNANTLVLRTLLDELITVGQHDKMDDIISYYLHADSIDDFFQRVIERITTDNQKGWIKDALSLIAVSKRGLSEKDILSITNTYQLYWSSFYCAFKNHFIVRNGLITFAHQYLRQAVEKKYFGTPSDILRNRGILINYFKEKESNQAYEELAYQYYKCEKYDELYDILIKQEIFTYLYDNDEIFLVQCWGTLDQKDETKYDIRKLFTPKPEEDVDNAEWIWIQYRFKVIDFIELFGRGDLLLASFEGLEDAGLTRPYWIKLYMSQANYFSSVGQIDEALKYYEYAYNVNDYLFPGSANQQGVNILNRMGGLYLSDYNPQKAICIFKSALDKAIESNISSEIRLAYTGLAEAYSELGDYENYEKYYQQSAQYIDAPEGTTTIDGAFSLSNIAISEFHTGRYKQAHHHLHQALRIFKKAYNNKGVQVAEVYHMIGSCYYCRKQYKTAILCKQKALELLLEVDKNHLKIPHVMKDIALNYQELGDLNNSILYYFRALRRHLKICCYEDMAKIYMNIATNYNDMGCYHKALKAIKIGIRIAQDYKCSPALLSELKFIHACCCLANADIKGAFFLLCETLEILYVNNSFSNEVINSISEMIEYCYKAEPTLKTIQQPSVLSESLSIQQKLALIQNEELSLTEKIHMVLLPMDEFLRSLKTMKWEKEQR